MDNNLTLHKMDFGDGAMDHLPFRLTITVRRTTTNVFEEQKEIGFFHLKDCLCRMFAIPLFQLSPQSAEAAGDKYYLTCQARHSEDSSPLAKFEILPADIAKGKPGVYFELLDDERSVRQVTGLPLPFSEEAVIPGYHLMGALTDTGQLQPTEAYGLLHAIGRAYLAENERLAARFPYQLTLKGTEYGTGASGDERSRYIVRHYYNNPQEAVKKLLQNNLYHFDKICNDNPHRIYHDTAYVQDIDQLNIAQIKARTRSEAAQPGIYLSSPYNAAELERLAGVDLTALPGYATNAKDILMAAYTLDQRTTLLYDQHQQHFVNRYPYLPAQEPSPQHPYHVTIHYKPDGRTDRMPVRDAYEHFHFSDIGAAISFLVATDLSKFTNSDDETGLGYTIHEAAVLDEKNWPHAMLDVGFGQERGDHLLSMFLVLSPRIPVSAGVVASLQHLSESREPTADDRIHIRIAELTGTLTWVPIRQTIEGLRQLLDGGPSQHLAQEQPLAVPPLMAHQQGNDVYILTQQWQFKTDPDPFFRTEELTVYGLFTAHSILRLLPADTFRPDNERDTPTYLAHASLRDATTGTEISSRYYLSEATEALQPGHYQQYNRAHPAWGTLAGSQPQLTPLAGVSTPAVFYFLDTTKTGTGQRTRIPDDRDGHRHGRSPSG